MTVSENKFANGLNLELGQITLINLPKTPQKVYELLCRRGHMTSVQIAKAVGVTDRTIRSALKVLYERGYARKVVNFSDMRSHFHAAIIVES